jgi:hypothetical protein
MCFGRRRTMNKFLLFGNAFFIQATLWNMMLRHHPDFPDGLGDGVMGLLYGVTFTCYIVGLIRARREDHN